MRVFFRPRILQYLLLIVSILDVSPLWASESSWALGQPMLLAQNKLPAKALITPTAPAAPAPLPSATTDKNLEELLTQEKYQEVVDQLTPQLEKLDGKKLKLLGRAQSGLKNQMLAIKTFSLALNKNPKDAEAKMLLGREDFLRGKDREAMISLREALEMNPNLEQAYLVIEQIYIKKKNNYELRMLYSDMVQQLGEKPQYIARLCELNTLSGIYDMAATYCLKGIKTQPNEPKNFIFRAMGLKETGSFEEAKNLYRSTAEQFKKSEDAQLAYAQFLDEQKNFLESSKYYKAALAANPNSMKALYGFAQASTEIQKYQDVYDTLATACQINRQAIAQVRKAMAVLRVLKETVWYEKFEALSESCGMPHETEKSTERTATPATEKSK